MRPDRCSVNPVFSGSSGRVHDIKVGRVRFSGLFGETSLSSVLHTEGKVFALHHKPMCGFWSAAAHCRRGSGASSPTNMSCTPSGIRVPHSERRTTKNRPFCHSPPPGLTRWSEGLATQRAGSLEHFMVLVGRLRNSVLHGDRSSMRR